MIIELPWPAKQLFPNWKRANHWTKYRKYERQARDDGATLTRAAIPYEKRAMLRQCERINLVVTFTPPDRRNRDDDGCIGAFKNWRDGIADAFQCDDRIFSCEYRFAEPCKPGGVKVEVVGVATGGDMG